MVKSVSAVIIWGAPGLMFCILASLFWGIKYVPLSQTELDPGLEIITDDYKELYPGLMHPIVCSSTTPLQYSICVHYYHSMRIFIL